MPSFSFKKQTNCYLVTEDDQQTLRVERFLAIEVSFSQTFTEKSYTRKGILNTDYFEGSVINKANPANFEISFYLGKFNSSPNFLSDLWSKAISPDPDFTTVNPNQSKVIGTFDLLIETEQDTFSLEDCVITNWVFGIERLQPLSITVSGEAKKLQRVGGKDYVSDLISNNNNYRNSAGSYNAVLDPISKDYLIPRALDLILNSQNISSCVTSVSLELQNDIKWTPYTNITDAISASNASTSMYPQGFTYDKKILSGTIIRYISDDNPDMLDWDSSATLTTLNIKDESDTPISISALPITFTNRITPDQIFIESYDWRATDKDALSKLTLTTT